MPLEPDGEAIGKIAREAFGGQVPIRVEPIGDGISTVVYRLGRGEETFYLRVLPEPDETFAPEAQVHALLRQRGVHVPEVVYLEDRNEALGRSVMVTTEIRGRHVGHLPPGEAAQRVLREAGRELALINSIPVDGFGWIRRDGGQGSALEGELPSSRAFQLDDIEMHLSLLAASVLTAQQVTLVRDLIQHSNWIDVPQAHLAHGDFDVTHIYQDNGRYTGIIDFGEIRGTGRYYDLGHFRLHDGETAPFTGLPFLLAGYTEVTPLPADGERQIAFLSLLIGIRFLARGLAGLMAHPLSDRARAHAERAIERELGVLLDVP